MKLIQNLILILGFSILFVCNTQASEPVRKDSNHAYLTTVSYQKLDSLQIQNKQQELIVALTQKQQEFEIRYYTLAGITLFLVLLFGVLCFFNKRGDKRLEKIVSLLEKYQNKEKKDSEKTTNNQLDIDETIISEILENLRVFEQEKGFLTSKITLHEFAKKIQTNTKYLSKVINTYKSKSFRNYINDLRVEHSINSLQNNLHFRKYTVSAIAKEAGFSTSESFTKAFRKRTGETVTEFVSKL
ncbi:helix-turn-helix domain-containing protein [Kordia algicida OT-1]|uniref:Transcriptional regulator n=1 Tax=Kordia algicida OT-1 TaxID=391587 RepID=A9DT79_9FLAO|nr:helix-turn-helix domain-containing protein [Kordia algicida]EDP97036.1 transcriptional regulator [Kordia algicida OT-1]